MLKERTHREEFTYNLSAFLAAARSVLVYALKEAETKPGGSKWYDDQINASPVLSFFRDKRNVNIHSEPVKPVQNINVTTNLTIHVSVSASVIHCDKNGNILHQSNSATTGPRPRATDPPSEVTITYKFVDWKGSEDIETLCQIYLTGLEKVVNDGVVKKLITG
jgi:hypothetical protein